MFSTNQMSFQSEIQTFAKRRGESLCEPSLSCCPQVGWRGLLTWDLPVLCSPHWGPGRSLRWLNLHPFLVWLSLLDQNILFLFFTCIPWKKSSAAMSSLLSAVSSLVTRVGNRNPVVSPSAGFTAGLTTLSFVCSRGRSRTAWRTWWCMKGPFWTPPRNVLQKHHQAPHDPPKFLQSLSIHVGIFFFFFPQEWLWLQKWWKERKLLCFCFFSFNNSS